MPKEVVDQIHCKAQQDNAATGLTVQDHYREVSPILMTMMMIMSPTIRVMTQMVIILMVMIQMMMTRMTLCTGRWYLLMIT